MLRDFEIASVPLVGTSLVEAGAGTGKTYNIASLYVRAIIDKKLTPGNILVLTYTEAATAELRQRLRARIKEAIAVLLGEETKDEFLLNLAQKHGEEAAALLKEALYRFDEARISTIHGFCQHLLKENSLAFGVNPEFEILTDGKELLQEITDRYWRNFISDTRNEFRVALQKYLVEQNLTPDALCADILTISGKKYVTVFPEQHSVDDFKDRFGELKRQFQETSKLLEKEYDQLCRLLESGVLHKGVYNKNIDLYLDNVRAWLKSEITPLAPVDKLDLFGRRMQQSFTKGNEPQPFALNDAVDGLIRLLDEFSEVEAVFLKEASGEIAGDYQRAKEERNLLTYDDLLLKVEKGIRQGNESLAKELRAKFPVALIDEFQDTDPIQYSIFHELYGKDEEHCFFMIGDPKQAIYSFRGADIHTYLKAREQADQEKRYSLRYNYRSSPGMIDAVNRVFECSADPFHMEKLAFTPAKFPGTKDPEKGELKKSGQSIAPLQFLQLETKSTTKGEIREEVAASVASEIVELLTEDHRIDDRQLAPGDIAVLVRFNKQARQVQDVLRGRGIKSVIKSRESVFRSREAGELIIMLSAILDPAFEDGIRAALSTEALGFNASGILELLENESKWDKEVSRFQFLQKRWNQHGFSEMISQMMREYLVEMNLGGFFDAERRITNHYHLVELLKKKEREYHFRPHALVRFLEKKYEDESGTPADEELIRLESDAGLVQIVTMHASKGLEYPVVFCPFLYEGINTSETGHSKLLTFHNEDGEAAIDLGTSGERRTNHRVRKLTEDLQDTLRLSYVALTRSASACFVHVVEGADFQFSPLYALVEDPEHAVQRIGNKVRKIKDKNEECDLIAKLKELSQQETIELRDGIINTKKVGAASVRQTLDFKILQYSGKDLENFPGITSFSALTGGSSDNGFSLEKPGFDYDAVPGRSGAFEDREKNRFSLPKGAKTGTLIHHIFEEIDFCDPGTFAPVIKEQVETQGFNPEWGSILEGMINNAVSQKLNDSVRLSDISKTDRLVEMEFHFPLESISYPQLVKIIRGEKSTSDGRSVRGFMKGFIDLVFRKEGRYYILDYKSNHLGDTPGDYTFEALQQEILHADYDLQYHIYTVALHRMLSNLVPGYSYEQHFGGVFYQFVRGINAEIPGSGVFYHKPDVSVINSLDTVFREGKRL